MQPAPALKEWAVVVRALLAGEQAIDVRKGGLREEGRHFSVDTDRCWLFPTYEHQQPELVKPAYRRWIDDEPAPPGGPGDIRIEGWAAIDRVVTITDPDAVAALDSKVIWTTDYLEQRFNWKRRDPLTVLVLRVHRLAEPYTVPWREEYGGCTSWVRLDGLPADPAAAPGRPVLSDEAFAASVQGLDELSG